MLAARLWLRLRPRLLPLHLHLPHAVPLLLMITVVMMVIATRTVVMVLPVAWPSKPAVLGVALVAQVPAMALVAQVPAVQSGWNCWSGNCWAASSKWTSHSPVAAAVANA